MLGLPERNMLRYVFLDESARDSIPSGTRVAAETVALVRLSAGEDPDDAQLIELVGEL